jgi:hypothetical protein
MKCLSQASQSSSRDLERDFIKKKVFVFHYSIRYSCQILMKLEFSDRYLKINQISNLTKICPVGAELLHEDRWTDGQADMMKLKVAFCNLANAPKFPRSAHIVYLWVLCGSQNKQRLFHYTALTVWFL